MWASIWRDPQSLAVTPGVTLGPDAVRCCPDPGVQGVGQLLPMQRRHLGRVELNICLVVRGRLTSKRSAPCPGPEYGFRDVEVIQTGQRQT